MDNWNEINFDYSQKYVPFISPKTFKFYGLKVSQGTARTLYRWGEKLNHLSTAYLLSNNQALS